MAEFSGSAEQAARLMKQSDGKDQMAQRRFGSQLREAARPGFEGSSRATRVDEGPSVTCPNCGHSFSDYEGAP
jgi:hypothetical protein